MSKRRLTGWSSRLGGHLFIFGVLGPPSGGAAFFAALVARNLTDGAPQPAFNPFVMLLFALTLAYPAGLVQALLTGAMTALLPAWSMRLRTVASVGIGGVIVAASTLLLLPDEGKLQELLGLLAGGALLGGVAALPCGALAAANARRAEAAT